VIRENAKMTKQEIIFDEDYEGQRFTYGFTYRPVGISCQPEGFIIGSNKDHSDFNFGTLDYPFELSQEQVTSYELTKVEKG